MKKFVFIFIPFILFIFSVTGCNKESKNKEPESSLTVTTRCDTVLYTGSDGNWKESDTIIEKGSRLTILEDRVFKAIYLSDSKSTSANPRNTDVFLVNVKHNKKEGYIRLSSCIFDDNLIEMCDSYIFIENPDYFIFSDDFDILEYIRIVCIKCDEEGSYYYEKDGSDALKFAFEEYKKRGLDFEPLADTLINNYHGYIRSDCFDLLMDEIENYRFGKDEDTIFALAAKKGNRNFFETLVLNCLVKENSDGDRRLNLDLLMYKNKSGKCLPEILAEINDQEMNLFIFPCRGAWDRLDINYYGDPCLKMETSLKEQYESEEILREKEYSDNAYVMEDCTMISAYGTEIKLKKGIELSNIVRMDDVAYTPDKENYYGIYFCSTENNLTGYVFGDKLAYDKVNAGESTFFYRKIFNSKENNGDIFELYTKEFKKINFIRSLSPGKYQNNLELNVYDLSYGNGISSDEANLEISDYGEHKFKGKEFRCLEFKYFHWKSLDSYDDVIQTLVFEQFIAFDENEAVAYEVLDIKPFCLLEFDICGEMTADIKWTFDEKDRGVIEFNGIEYNRREPEMTHKVNYIFKPVDTFYYDAPDFTATNRKK
nr:hypothetical protein [uncultured Treponema sp.]